MTTIYDVARVAAVSTATVSRVLRGSDLVHPNTRQRVLAVIETLGFVPDASARGLTRRRKDIIGLVGLDRGGDEIDIERTSLLFVDHIVHATETVLRGTENSLLLTFGSPGELFGKRVRCAGRPSRRPAHRRGSHGTAANCGLWRGRYPWSLSPGAARRPRWTSSSATTSAA